MNKSDYDDSEFGAADRYVAPVWRTIWFAAALCLLAFIAGLLRG